MVFPICLGDRNSREITLYLFGMYSEGGVNRMKSKESLPEENIKNNYIMPAIVDAYRHSKSQMHFEHSFTDERANVKGNMTSKAKQKRADYLLMHKSNYTVAIVEANDVKHPIRGGMQQALKYAEILDITYAYSSNG